MECWKLFGSKNDEEPGKWRRLHNREFCDLYSTPNYIRVMKLRRMRWAFSTDVGQQRCIESFGGEM
jgi:hypothetical protein